MINIRTLRKLTNNDGLTLKAGKIITYKSGWQVATEGQETANIQEAMMMIRQYNGDCGVWYSEGIYYIDKSHRVNTKREAIEIGRQCNQISVLCWRTMGLAYCCAYLIAAADSKAHARAPAVVARVIWRIMHLAQKERVKFVQFDGLTNS